MTTHSISAFTFRSSASVSTRSQEKYTWGRLFKPASQISHKNKNLWALSGDGMWKKYREKWHSKAGWLKIVLVALLLWIPERIKKTKITKRPICWSPHIIFSFSPRQNQGCITEKQPKCRVPPLHYPPNHASHLTVLPPVPGNHSLVSSLDRNKRLEGTPQTAGLSQPNLAKC